MEEQKHNRRRFDRLKMGRRSYTTTLTMIVICILFLVDPDSGLIQNLPFGAQALGNLISALRPVIVITMIHYTRKWIFDYVDISEIYGKVLASENYVAMAIFALAMGIFTLAFSIVFAVGANT